MSLRLIVQIIAITNLVIPRLDRGIQKFIGSASLPLQKYADNGQRTVYSKDPDYPVKPDNDRKALYICAHLIQRRFTKTNLMFSQITS
jgi:hypothetical protein